MGSGTTEAEKAAFAVAFGKLPYKFQKQQSTGTEVTVTVAGTGVLETSGGCLYHRFRRIFLLLIFMKEVLFMNEGIACLQGMQSGSDGMGEYGVQGEVTLTETFGCTHREPCFWKFFRIMV